MCHIQHNTAEKQRPSGWDWESRQVAFESILACLVSSNRLSAINYDHYSWTVHDLRRFFNRSNWFSPPKHTDTAGERTEPVLELERQKINLKNLFPRDPIRRVRNRYYRGFALTSLGFLYTCCHDSCSSNNTRVYNFNLWPSSTRNDYNSKKSFYTTNIVLRKKKESVRKCSHSVIKIFLISLPPHSCSASFLRPTFCSALSCLHVIMETCVIANFPVENNYTTSLGSPSLSQFSTSNTVIFINSEKCSLHETCKSSSTSQTHTGGRGGITPVENIPD